MSKPSFSLTGQVALVTGASSGLGAHFARTLADAGAEVIVTARRLDRIEALAAALREGGGKAHAVALDVTDAASVEACFQRAVDTCGRVDVLVNNAGIASTRAFVEMDDAGWQAIIDTNLTGLMRVARQASRAMIAGGRGGAIVNVASILGLRAASHLAPYAAAKAGVISLTQTMAIELARHAIRVNALAPGYVETDLNRDFLGSAAGQALAKRIPMRRFGMPEDLDGPLLLLLSDAGRFVTGVTLPVDGGHLLSFI